jgi:electron transport complex protein RnfC
MNNSQLSVKPVKGGIYITPQKQHILQRQIETIKLPKQLFLALTDPRGQRRELIVENGKQVLKGQSIAISTNGQSVAIHASSSGILKYSETDHAQHLVIETDGKDLAAKYSPVLNPFQIPPRQLIDHIEQAAVTGMGGAGFPAHLKLLAALEKPPKILILNAVECDPYTACDSALLIEQLDCVLNGAKLIMHICAATRCMIAIEDHQIELRQRLQQAITERVDHRFEVVVVPTKYPSGSEQQLVEHLTGNGINSEQTALDVNVICFNIATVVAINHAITTGEPVLQRIVTISGPGIAQPKNLLVAIGTPINTLLNACGVLTENKEPVIGGVMMGQTAQSVHAAIQKETYSVWIPEITTTTPQPQPCIRCAECAYVCPSHLQPQTLFRLAEAHHWNQLEQDKTLTNCIECGACDLVCPSHIPLTQTFIQAKQHIQAIQQSRHQAQHAQQRYLARQERLEKLAEQKQQTTRKRKKPGDVKDIINRIKNKVENNNQS